MTNAIWDLQRAVYDALVADAALKAEIGDPARVYDLAPPDAVFPYLTLGEVRAEDWRGVDGGLKHDLRLYAFSRYAGRREIKTILGAVYDVLHEAALTLANHELINLRFVFSDVFRRQDGDTYQGVVSFRALTQPVGGA